MGAANHFLKHRLKAWYEALEADRIHRYDTALYWRFLCEQYGDMGIIRAALEEMAYGAHPDVEASLSAVMDAALARYDGPFERGTCLGKAFPGLTLQSHCVTPL